MGIQRPRCNPSVASPLCGGKLIFTDCISEEDNAIGSVRVSVRPFVFTLTFEPRIELSHLDRLHVYGS